MATPINWSILDFERFQAFCNLLLHLEVSPRCRGFNAPGRDKGYDSEFVGEYRNLQGKWRFQAKFHLTDAKTAFNSLKAELKSDILKNLKDEDHVVFLTNVPLLKQKQDEILETLLDCMKSQPRPVNVEIWDGACLETLLQKHPIVYKTYWGGAGGILEPFRNAFASKLDEKNEGPFNLHHPAVERKAEMKQLFAFVENDNDRLLAIVGPGGHGKTRLAVDFFIAVEQEDLPWHCFALVPRKNIEPQVFKQLLVGNSNLLILIDDAHEVEQLSDLVAIAQLGEFRDRIKLLLTSRTAKSELLGAQIGFQQQFRTINLRPLSTQDTSVAVLQYFQPVTLPASKVRWITSKSKGVPIMIQALCYAYKTQNNLDIFGDEINLDNAIKAYLAEIIQHAADTTSLPVEKVRLAIWALALISPFNNHNYLFKLGETLDIPSHSFLKLISSLRTNWLLEQFDSGYFVWYDDSQKVSDFFEEHGEPTNKVLNLTISPDPVAELVVLWNIQNDELIQKILGWALENQIGRNVILNIHKSSLIHGVHASLSKDLLLQYLDGLKSEAEKGNMSAWSQLFSTIRAIQVVEPGVVFAFIDDFVRVASEDNHPIHTTLAQEKEPKGFLEHFREQISSLYSTLVLNVATLEQAFNLLPTLGQLYTEKNGFLLAGYAVHTFDFQEEDSYTPFRRQDLILNCIMGVRGASEFQRALLLTIAPLLLRSKFVEHSELGPFSDRPGVFWRVMLPNHPAIVEFRIKLIRVLITTYDQIIPREQSERVLEILFQNLTDVRLNRAEVLNSDPRSTEFYDPEGEYRVLFAFLQRLSSKIGDLSLKRLLSQKFYSFNYFRASEDIRSMMSEFDRQISSFSSVWDEISYKVFFESSRYGQGIGWVLHYLQDMNSEQEVADGLAIMAKWEKELGISQTEGVSKIIEEVFKCEKFNLQELFTYLYQNYSRLAIRLADEFLYEVRIHHRAPIEYFEKRASQLFENHGESGLFAIRNLYGPLFYVQNNGFEASDFDLRLLKRIYLDGYSPARPSIGQAATVRLSPAWHDLLVELLKRYPEKFQEFYVQYLQVASNETAQRMLGTLAYQIEDDVYPLFRDLLFNKVPNLDIRTLVSWDGSLIIGCLKHREGLGETLKFISKELRRLRAGCNPALSQGSSLWNSLLGMTLETMEPIWTEYFAVMDWVMNWDIPSDEFYPNDVWEMFKMWMPSPGKQTEILPWLRQLAMAAPAMDCFKIGMILRAGKMSFTDFDQAVSFLRRRMPPNYEAFEAKQLKSFDPQWNWGVDNLTWILQFFREHPLHHSQEFLDFSHKLAKEYAMN